VGAPPQFPGPGIDGNEITVLGAHVNQAMCYDNPAIDNIATGVASPRSVVRHRIEGPEQRASCGVERVDLSPVPTGIHGAIDDDGSGFETSVGTERVLPGETQSRHVLLVDGGKR